MSLTLTYPGVYVKEEPSGVRTITGVSTSNTAFIDFFKRGPIDEAVRVTSWEDFERRFGGLDQRSEASYAIMQYYLNGGSIAWVVRVVGNKSTKATLSVKEFNGFSGSGGPDYYNVGISGEGAPNYSNLGVSGVSKPVVILEIEAANPGVWGNNLQVGIDYFGLNSDNIEPSGFNLVVREVVDDVVVNYEVYRNLNSKNEASPRYVDSVINESSSLIRVKCKKKGWPEKTGEDVISVISNVEKIEKNQNKSGQNIKNYSMFGIQPDNPGSDGFSDNSDWGISSSKAKKIEEGMKKLERIAPEVFNLLCLPAVFKLEDKDYLTLIEKATKFCRDNRAFFIVDVKHGVKYEDLSGWMRNNDRLRSDHSAIYFPLMKIADPLNENRPREVAPSGTIAGVYARTDAQRGIWKAPAGTEASLVGATLCEKLTDLENGSLNPIGINVLRNFPIHGNIAWGARTLDGADQKTSEYKYVPVRRLALYIEESLYQGLKWVVFEPNDEALWAQIRFNVGAFMNGLFRQRAFQGATAREAYFVKCDKDTTTQNDIDRGIVNVVVGFKPLKPAEFVVLRMQQIAGQLAV